jgi:putative lipoic acid-binding regulatory protein
MSASAVNDSLIEYPCVFPIKVMGQHVPDFLGAMVELVRGFDASFDPSTIEQRASKGGNYLGLTLHVHVTDRQQLDSVYRTLTAHPLVKVVL